MTVSTAIGDLLFKKAFWLYRPLYSCFKRIQDRNELSALRSHVRPGDTVLDIGANIGFYAAELSALTGPEGSVYCFEPHPDNFEKLARRRTPYNNVHINQLAVSDRDGEITFYTSHELNVDHRAYKPERYHSEIKVKAVTIDDFVTKNQIRKVDFIKMDIQGYELSALSGMQQTLRLNQNICLITEFWPYGLKTAGRSAAAYYDALQKLGFFVYLLDKKPVLLTREGVAAMERRGKEYYNILAKRSRV